MILIVVLTLVLVAVLVMNFDAVVILVRDLSRGFGRSLRKDLIHDLSCHEITLCSIK